MGIVAKKSTPSKRARKLKPREVGSMNIGFAKVRVYEDANGVVALDREEFARAVSISEVCLRFLPGFWVVEDMDFALEITVLKQALMDELAAPDNELGLSVVHHHKSLRVCIAAIEAWPHRGLGMPSRGIGIGQR